MDSEDDFGGKLKIFYFDGEFFEKIEKIFKKEKIKFIIILESEGGFGGILKIIYGYFFKDWNGVNFICKLKKKKKK